MVNSINLKIKECDLPILPGKYSGHFNQLIESKDCTIHTSKFYGRCELKAYKGKAFVNKYNIKFDNITFFCDENNKATIDRVDIQSLGFYRIIKINQNKRMQSKKYRFFISV